MGFEEFWIAKGASPGSTRGIEAFARERKRSARSRRGLSPGGFVSLDSPIEVLSVFRQKNVLGELQEIATHPQSAIQPGSWPDFVGLDQVPSEARASLAEQAFGARELPRDVRIELGFDEEFTDADADEMAMANAREWLLEKCEQVDAAGVDGADFLERAAAGDPPPELEGIDQVALADDVGDIREEFGVAFVQEVIEECRDLLAGPDEAPAPAPVAADVVDELRERFDLGPVTDLEDALARLEERLAAGEERGREAAVNRLSRAFGARFEDLDEAIGQLRERIPAARGERLRRADIRVRRVGDEIRVTIQDGGAFDPFQDNVERQVARELDLSGLRQGERAVVGEIRLEGDELSAIDLDVGRERFGPGAEAGPIDVEERERFEFEPAETPAEELADELLDDLE